MSAITADRDMQFRWVLKHLPGGDRQEYASRLVYLCVQYGFDIYTGKEITCLHRLENPRHVANSKDCHLAMPVGIVGARNIENPVWLRRGPAADPKQWGLLSQVFEPYEDPGGTALRLGAAPYGRNSQALLYLGRARS